MRSYLTGARLAHPAGIKKESPQSARQKTGTPYGETTYEKSPPSIQSIWHTIQPNSRAQTLLSRYFESNSRQLETIGAISRQAPARPYRPATSYYPLSAERCNYAKQSQFAKMRNSPKPIHRKDL
jgi:hypothetical protein